MKWKRSNSIEGIKQMAWWRGAASTFTAIFAVHTIGKVASGDWMQACVSLAGVLASVLWLWACQERKPGGSVWYVSGDVDIDCTADNMEHVMSKEAEDE